MRKTLVPFATFFAGWFLCYGMSAPHRRAKIDDPSPVEVFSSTGVKARLVCYRVVEGGVNRDLSAAGGDDRPMWHIRFKDGRVGYFLVEDVTRTP